MNYIGITVQYYLYLFMIALVYKFVFFLRLFGFYQFMAGNNPVVLLGYASFLHSFGVGFLYYALYYNTTFYLVFLSLNGLWLGFVTVLVFLGSMNFWEMENFKKDPLNHMLLVIHFVTAAVIEILVFLHKDTRIVPNDLQLVSKKDEKKSKSDEKKKVVPKEVVVTPSLAPAAPSSLSSKTSKSSEGQSAKSE